MSYYRDFIFPLWTVSPLINGDYSSLSKEESTIIENVIAQLPKGGVWEVSGEKFLSHFNDLTNQGGYVVTITYMVLPA